MQTSIQQVAVFVVAALTASGPHLAAAHRPQIVELMAADEFESNSSQASDATRKVQCKCYYKCWLNPIEYSYTARVEHCNGGAIARLLEQRAICKYIGLYNGAWNCEEQKLPREFELDFNIVEQYIRLTQAAVCNHRCLEVWSGRTLSSVGVQGNKGLILGPAKESGMTGFVVRVEDSARLAGADCVASFRGTQGEQIDNIIANAKTYPVDWRFGNCPGCKVHRGFQDAYGELRDALRRHIENLGCKRVAFTGHSLGAAVATIATLDRRLHGADSPTPYLFHSPRVGNQAFSDAFEKSHEAPAAFRFVNGCDPVPRVPPRSFGFVHIPGEIYWHDDGEVNKEMYQICRGTEDPHCMDMRSLALCLAQFKDQAIGLHMSLFGENMWPDSDCQRASCKGDPRQGVEKSHPRLETSDDVGGLVGKSQDSLDDEITCECSYNCKVAWWDGPGMQKSYRMERRDCDGNGMKRKLESYSICQRDIWGEGIQSVWWAGIQSVWSCSEK